MNSRIVITTNERQCLLDLINKYPAVASISTNHLQLGEKKNAWAKLTDDFNSIADNQKRTQAQLKKCWDNIKTKRKMELCEEKRSRLKTGGGRLSPSGSQEHHQADRVLDLATNIEMSFSYDSDRSICHNDTAVPSTSSVFSMPWTDQSTEEPVFDITGSPKKRSTPQLKKTRRVVPNKDLMRNSGQVIQDEAEVRCLRSKKLIQYDEEIHQVRLETAQEQRETARQQTEIAREQLRAACLQTKLLELELKKKKAEFEE